MGMRNWKGTELTNFDVSELRKRISSDDPAFSRKEGRIRRWMLNPDRDIFSGIMSDRQKEVRDFIKFERPEEMEITDENWFFITVAPSLYLRHVSYLPTMNSPRIELNIPGIGSEASFIRNPPKDILGARVFSSADYTHMAEEMLLEEVELEKDGVMNFLRAEPYTVIWPYGRPRKLSVEKQELRFFGVTFKFPKHELTFIDLNIGLRGRKRIGNFATLLELDRTAGNPPDIERLGAFLGPEVTGFPYLDLEGHYMVNMPGL